MNSVSNISKWTAHLPCPHESALRIEFIYKYVRTPFSSHVEHTRTGIKINRSTKLTGYIHIAEHIRGDGIRHIVVDIAERMSMCKLIDIVKWIASWISLVINLAVAIPFILPHDVHYRSAYTNKGLIRI